MKIHDKILTMATRQAITVGDIVHTYNRGTRKLAIVHDELDRDYFLKALFYLNDSRSIPGIFRALREEYPDLLARYEWPIGWKERDPLVRVHAYILMPNHFHLVLEEIRENGIPLFMQKLSTGLTCRYNIRYKTSGSLFQGRYKYVRVAEEDYLQYLGAYVQVKNAFELFDGGLKSALHDFNKAFDFACSYQYGSLSHYVGVHSTPIITSGKSVFFEIKDRAEYKKFVHSILDTPDFEEQLVKVKID